MLAEISIISPPVWPRSGCPGHGRRSLCPRAPLLPGTCRARTGGRRNRDTSFGRELGSCCMWEGRGSCRIQSCDLENHARNAPTLVEQWGSVMGPGLIPRPHNIHRTCPFLQAGQPCRAVACRAVEGSGSGCLGLRGRGPRSLVRRHGSLPRTRGWPVVGEQRGDGIAVAVVAGTWDGEGFLSKYRTGSGNDVPIEPSTRFIASSCAEDGTGGSLR